MTTCDSCDYFKTDGQVQTRSCTNHRSRAFRWSAPNHTCELHRAPFATQAEAGEGDLHDYSPTWGVSKEEYREYLQSQEWWDRRNKVMERAGGQCEGCRDADATDVHHLTYEHVTEEFLHELLALCAPCHERIHGGTGKSAEAQQRQTRRTWAKRRTDGKKWRDQFKGRW